MSPPFAIVAGVGPGIGASVARRLAQAYPVVLLARRQASFEQVMRDIHKDGGRAITIIADVSREDDIVAAIRKASQELRSTSIAMAVFNASGPFSRKSFRDITAAEFEASWKTSCAGALYFAQSTLPGLLEYGQLKAVEEPPPTMVFTGATASLKSNALMSSFATAKFALRALVQSIAKEVGPQGVHVAHAIIDGVVDIARAEGPVANMNEQAKIDPNGIAEMYWQLHLQSVRCFSNEVDIRPMMERW